MNEKKNRSEEEKNALPMRSISAEDSKPQNFGNTLNGVKLMINHIFFPTPTYIPLVSIVYKNRQSSFFFLLKK